MFLSLSLVIERFSAETEIIGDAGCQTEKG